MPRSQASPPVPALAAAGILGELRPACCWPGPTTGTCGSGDSWTLWVGPQVRPRIAGGGKLVDVGGRTHPPGGRFRGDLEAFPAGWSPPLSDSRRPCLLLGGFRPNARFHGGSCERKGEGAHVAALETGDASGSFLKGRGGALQVQEWVGCLWH